MGEPLQDVFELRVKSRDICWVQPHRRHGERTSRDSNTGRRIGGVKRRSDIGSRTGGAESDHSPDLAADFSYGNKHCNPHHHDTNDPEHFEKRDRQACEDGKTVHRGGVCRQACTWPEKPPDCNQDGNLNAHKRAAN